MARIRGVESREAGWFTRLVYWIVRRKIGKLGLDSRVGKWRGRLGAAYRVLTLSVVSASRAGPCPVSTSPSSNRTGRFPASGSPTGFATRATEACDHAAFLGLARGFGDR
jgi:hypothetical protein